MNSAIPALYNQHLEFVFCNQYPCWATNGEWSSSRTLPYHHYQISYNSLQHQCTVWLPRVCWLNSCIEFVLPGRMHSQHLSENKWAKKWSRKRRERIFKEGIFLLTFNTVQTCSGVNVLKSSQEKRIKILWKVQMGAILYGWFSDGHAWKFDTSLNVSQIWRLFKTTASSKWKERKRLLFPKEEANLVTYSLV